MNELLGRQAPHSASAEQAVLGSMLIDPRCISVSRGLDKVKSDDFYIQQNREIFETMFAMFAYGQTIDPVTVLDQMRVRGVYKEGSSQQYLMELMQITPTAANVLEYAAIVRDRALLRGLAAAADEINNMVYEGAGEADDMLEAAERKIYALRKDRSTGGLMPVSVVVQNVYDQLSEAAASESAVPGLTTRHRRPGPHDTGHGPRRPHPHRLPPRHGQDQHGAEHRHARGQGLQKDRGRLFAGDDARAAGDAPARRRGPGGQPEAADGPAELRRVGGASAARPASSAPRTCASTTTPRSPSPT